MTEKPERPIQVPADREIVAEVRKFLDIAGKDCPFEVYEGGIDDNGVAYAKLRKKAESGA